MILVLILILILIPIVLPGVSHNLCQAFAIGFAMP